MRGAHLASSRPARAALVVAALTLVGGCGSAPPEHPAVAHPAVGADHGTQAGHEVEHAGGVGHWSSLAAAAEQALNTEGPDGRQLEFFETPLARGDDLEVGLIAARGRVPAPARAADEVLIVVQAPLTDDHRPCAVLSVEGRPFEVTAGTVAVLPAGTRGALEPAKGARGQTIFMIVARALKPGPTTSARAWVADLAALDPQLRRVPTNGPSITEVASIGDRLGLYVLALATHAVERSSEAATNVVPGVLPPQVHPGHDEVLLLLVGEGNLALGRTSHRVQAGSLVLIPAGVSFYMTNDAPGAGTRALLISAPATAGEDVQLLDSR